MKYPPRNTTQNEAKKQPVFSDKMMGNILIKLKQLAEIEFLLHTEKKSPSKKK
ncbi:hypothetical protein [Chryseobacterium sp. SL1]|uniref:hypothetical protein n=1 Tax=Chryseobacterium sp. SL1 TaxID=2995159 RepID=UPI0022739C4B|nr:hypothetical protein [Chryseobacterium sp. SL1]MCY1660904.1 hypothetical protein [Chryseobacterium sp. SL1]